MAAWSRVYRTTLGWVFLVAVVFNVATYFLSLYLGFTLFYFTAEGAELADKFIGGLAVYLFLSFGTVLGGSASVGVVFLALWSIFIISILISWAGPGASITHVMRDAFAKPVEQITRNFLFAFPVLANMLLIATLLVHALQESGGVSTGSLEAESPFLLFFSTSYAAVFEEVGFRIVPFSILIAGYLLLCCRASLAVAPAAGKLKFTVMALFYPEGAKRKFGMPSVHTHGWIRGISKVEWAVIILTAFAFGMAHVFSGSGWGPGKFTTAFIGGVVLGLVYIVYGAQASILMHWFFNFYLPVYSLSSDFYHINLTPVVVGLNISAVMFGTLGWIGLLALLLRKGAVRRWTTPPSVS